MCCVSQFVTLLRIFRYPKTCPFICLIQPLICWMCIVLVAFFIADLHIKCKNRYIKEDVSTSCIFVQKPVYVLFSQTIIAYPQFLFLLITKSLAQNTHVWRVTQLWYTCLTCHAAVSHITCANKFMLGQHNKHVCFCWLLFNIILQHTC